MSANDLQDLIGLGCFLIYLIPHRADIKFTGASAQLPFLFLQIPCALQCNWFASRCPDFELKNFLNYKAKSINVLGQLTPLNLQAGKFFGVLQVFRSHLFICLFIFIFFRIFFFYCFLSGKVQWIPTIGYNFFFGCCNLRGGWCA